MTDAIIAEQEINHLTKEEILIFLNLCRKSLVKGGTLLVHSLNGANPITGSEALAQNFDHYNTFTEYSLRQVLEHSGFCEVNVFPLNLYVFYNNPLNYVALLADRINTLIFRINFILYGKHNRIFTKKIAAVGKKKDADRMIDSSKHIRDNWRRISTRSRTARRSSIGFPTETITDGPGERCSGPPPGSPPLWGRKGSGKGISAPSSPHDPV